MGRTVNEIIWQSVVVGGAMLGVAGCPLGGGGGGRVCRPARAEEMPRSPMWDVQPATTPLAEQPVPEEEAEAEGGMPIADLEYAVMLTSEPSGAQVFVNDTLFGVTPLMVQLQGGEVAVRVELEGYATAPHTMPIDQHLVAHVQLVTVEEASRPTEVCEHRGRGFVVA